MGNNHHPPLSTARKQPPSNPARFLLPRRLLSSLATLTLLLLGPMVCDPSLQPFLLPLTAPFHPKPPLTIPPSKRRFLCAFASVPSTHWSCIALSTWHGIFLNGTPTHCHPRRPRVALPIPYRSASRPSLAKRHCTPRVHPALQLSPSTISSRRCTPIKLYFAAWASVSSRK